MSEKTIEEYLLEAINAQANWVKLLFKKEQVKFVLDEHGDIVVAVGPAVSDSKAKRVVRLISKYIRTNPSPCISIRQIH